MRSHRLPLIHAAYFAICNIRTLHIVGLHMWSSTTLHSLVTRQVLTHHHPLPPPQRWCCFWRRLKARFTSTRWQQTTTSMINVIRPVYLKWSTSHRPISHSQSEHSLCFSDRCVRSLYTCFVARLSQWPLDSVFRIGYMSVLSNVYSIQSIEECCPSMLFSVCLRSPLLFQGTQPPSASHKLSDFNNSYDMSTLTS